jgi:meiotically up-regulated gene 157 (Mug157) protein
MLDTKVIVGAPYDDDYRGAVYVYNTDGTGELKITASDRAQYDRFGSSVAVTDTKVVVGAPYNDDPNNSGSVYVYNLDGTGEVKITASDGATSDNFGSSVAMSDTHIVVGVSLADIVGSSSGCVYVYNTDGTGEVKITPSDAADNERFGNSVAIQGDKIIVGTPQTGSGAVYVYNTDGSGEQKISAPAGAVGIGGISFGRSVATK